MDTNAPKNGVIFDEDMPLRQEAAGGWPESLGAKAEIGACDGARRAAALSPDGG